jgi:hypothetical protein
MRRPECLFFDFLEIYIIFRRASRGRMALMRVCRSLLRLCLFSHPIPHVPELVPHMARRPDHGHQEIEHKLVQQIENNYQKK